VFSPDSTRLGILNGNSAEVIDSATGQLLARFDLGEQHRSVAFADERHLYIGSESGALRVVSQDASDSWSLQNLWQGEAAIRWLEASPRSRFLVLVDRNSLVRQFSLAEGRIGDMTLQLASPVAEVTFTPGGQRVLIRTSNWMHRASSAATGLIWIDAVLAPHALDGARVVFGDPEANSAAALGSRLFLPVAADGYARLAVLRFSASNGTGLFGNKDKLLDEWRRKLALVTAQGPDE
jgi:hypothetical protein